MKLQEGTDVQCEKNKRRFRMKKMGWLFDMKREAVQEWREGKVG